MVELTINKLISSAMQIVLFALVPFIWWIITARKNENFFKWIGLKGNKALAKKGVVFSVIGVIILFTGVTFFSLYMLKGIEAAANEFDGLGAAGLLPGFIYAFFNTSLPEEILFRGFLLKRLSSRLGFVFANILQSIIFGIMHGVMFFSMVGVVKALFIIVLTGTVAYIIGYVNEKKAEGSIIPSWIIHGVTNLISAVIAMFSLV